jgi:nudix-type nucleoside diphosphatase (YffH/AdpP family)
MRRVEIEKKRIILDDFFKVEEAYLRYEQFDGSLSTVVRRLSFERGDSAAVLLYSPKMQRILLVNQFKYPTYAKGPGWITETAAGMIANNESPEDTARREVEEEMGYRVVKLEHISTFYVSPGGSSERIVLYYAEVDRVDKTKEGGGLLSEGENITTVQLSLNEALEQIRNGQIADAKTIVGILWLQTRLVGDRAEPGRSQFLGGL